MAEWKAPDNAVLVKEEEWKPPGDAVLVEEKEKEVKPKDWKNKPEDDWSDEQWDEWIGGGKCFFATTT